MRSAILLRDWVRSYLGSYVRIMLRLSVPTFCAGVLAVVFANDLTNDFFRYLRWSTPSLTTTYFIAVHGILLGIVAIGILAAPFAFAAAVFQARGTDWRERTLLGVWTGIASASMLSPWIELQTKNAKAARLRLGIRAFNRTLLLLWLLGPIALWLIWTAEQIFTFTFVSGAEFLGKPHGESGFAFDDWDGRFSYLINGVVSVAYSSALFVLSLTNWRYALRTGVRSSEEVLDPSVWQDVRTKCWPLTPLAILIVSTPFLIALYVLLGWIGVEL